MILDNDFSVKLYTEAVMFMVPTGTVITFVIYIAIGFAVPIFSVSRLIYIHKNYKKVKAVCVRVDTVFDTDSEGNTIRNYKPYWQYYFGETRFESAVSFKSSSVDIPVGTEEMIYVNPKNPKKIYIKYPGTNYFFTIVIMILLCAVLYFLFNFIRYRY